MHLGMTGIGTKEEGPKEPPIQNNRLIRVSHKRYHDLLLDNRPSYLEYTYRMFHPISRICCIVLIISILFTFVFGLHRMGSATMQPSLQDGDLILYYRMPPRYYTNDVKMYNLCSDELKENYKFVNYLVKKFKEDSDSIVRIANHFLKKSTFEA